MRSLLAFAALAALSTAPKAQGIPGLDLGVAGGVNFSSLADARTADLENTTGYHIGVYADVSVLALALRTGVAYLSAGDLETTSGDPVASADFVSVPVDIQIRTPTPAFQGYLLLGPEARFAIDTADDLPRIDRKSPNVAGNVGVGARFASPLGGTSGFVELRYARDLTGFAEDAGLITENEYRLDLILVRAGIGL